MFSLKIKFIIISQFISVYHACPCSPVARSLGRHVQQSVMRAVWCRSGVQSEPRPGKASPPMQKVIIWK